jgi:hypothetical protein
MLKPEEKQKKQAAGKFSSFNECFPQLFHTEMWNEMASNSGRSGRFYTYAQALLLLLDIY